MLVCFVSAPPRRAAIAAAMVEPAGAADDIPSVAGFALLADEPAAANESIGAFVGELLHEAANASDTSDLAGLLYTAAIDEPAAAAAAQDGAIGAAPATDPHYANVNLLLDYDAADGSTSFIDQKFSVTMGVDGNTQHDTGVTPLYGTSSFLFDGTGDALRLSDDPKWHLGTSHFTIDFTVRPTSVTGTRFWIGQWQATPNLGWVLYQFNDSVWLNVSTNGTNTFSDVGSAAGTLVINTWSRWRLDFDGIKYRLYKDGTMVGSSTTLRSINNSTVALAIGSNSGATSFYFQGNCRGIRLTLGVARTASDSGYTVVNTAFPTS